jgi:hypothetical protein
MPDIVIAVVSGETVDLGLAVPGVQGPVGQGVASGGASGTVLVKQSSTNFDAAWTATLSGIVLIAPTLSGTIVNNSTISKGTYIAPSVTSGTFISPIVTSGTFSAPAISGGTLASVTATNGIYTSPSIVSPTISGGTFRNSTISGGTISGIVSTGSGLVLASASGLLGFYGATATLRPSGIVIPSGGASTSEVGTTVSGIIVALRNLGLLSA